MFHLHSHTATVLAAAAAHFFVGWLWYSEYLFGPMWKKLGGKCSGMSKDMRVNLAASFATSLVIATASLIAISIFQQTQTGIYSREGLSRVFSWFLQDNPVNNTMLCSMKTLAFLWAGFCAPMSLSSVIWGGKNLHRWILEEGSDLASLLAVAATIALIS